MNSTEKTREKSENRRSFLRKGMAMGAAGLIPVSGFRAVSATPRAQSDEVPVTSGDVAILKFLAAAELVEDDLWQQYCELAVNNRSFNRALRRIDPSLVRYVCDDRDDERSHAALINAVLVAIGEEPVNLDAFRTLPGVPVQGAENIGRITNLTNLTVDTSWFLRYRGSGNPDFGDSFPQLVDIVNRPTVPTTDRLTQREVQAIAHSAAFHFCSIEQGGGSLYSSLLTKATNLNVVTVLAAIGPTEIYHFAAFHKSLELLFGLSLDHGDGRGSLDFPDLRSKPDLAQAIFPEPARFLREDFPLCSVIRPQSTDTAGAVAAATGLVASGLFEGQSQAFFDAVTALAEAADAATREL